MKSLINKICSPTFIKISKIICIILITLVGGFYYYFLQIHFYPSSEEIISILYIHYNSLLPDFSSFIQGNPFYWFSSIIYNLFGISTFSVRIFFTLMYCIILCLGIIIVLRSHSSFPELIIAVLIFSFFSVLLHPFGGNSNFGILAPMIHFFYYNTHQLPIIAGLLSILLLDIIISSDKHCIKIITLLLLISQSLFSLFKTDLCYALIFLAPVCIICLIQLWQQTDNHTHLLFAFPLILSTIIVTRRIPLISSTFFWDNESVSVYSGPFYGATSWLNVSDIINHLIKFIKNLLLFSNSDFSEYPLIGGYSIIFALRLLLLIYGLSLVVTTVFYSLKNTTAYKGSHQIIDELIGWSIALQSFVYIFTSFSDSDDQFRYVWSIVILIPILISRSIPRALELLSSKLKEKKLHITYATCLLLVSLNISFAGAGTDEYEEPFEDELENVCKFIYSKNINQSSQDNIIGIAPYWFFARLSLETGEVFLPLDYVKQNQNIDYIVTNVDTSNHSASALRIGLYDDVAIRELFGEPLEVYEQEHINVYVYR